MFINKKKLQRTLDFFKPEHLAQTPIQYDPAKADVAVLLIDVQDIFCDPKGPRGSDETKEVSERIGSIIPAFRAAGIPVYAVYTESPYNKSYHKRRADKNNTQGFYKYHPVAGDCIVAKTWDSAFQSTELDKILKKDGRRKLLVCGFNFSACVKETVIAARNHGYETWLMPDLTGNDSLNQGLTEPNGSVVVENVLAFLKLNAIRMRASHDILSDINQAKAAAAPRPA